MDCRLLVPGGSPLSPSRLPVLKPTVLKPAVLKPTVLKPKALALTLASLLLPGCDYVLGIGAPEHALTQDEVGLDGSVGVDAGPSADGATPEATPGHDGAGEGADADAGGGGGGGGGADAGEGADADAGADSDADADAGDARADTGASTDAGDAQAGCTIDGSSYASGAPDPTNACASCQPSLSASSWSNVADGTTCATGRICHDGTCASGCDVAGTFYAASAPDPNNACQSCQPGASVTTWTDVADGTSCGNGQVCSSGACGTQCDIGGTIVASGAADPGNACQSCQPGASTSAWTSDANGTSCGAGSVCNAGTCAPGCFIGATVYAPAAANPGNACQSCQPTASTTAWSNDADGTSCATGEVCSAGTCSAECFIGGTLYASSEVDPGNDCKRCAPSSSTTSWTSVADGTSCAAGEICSAGACAADCDIAGTIYASGAARPGNACQTCQPTSSTTAWSNLADGSGCGGSSQCLGGACVAKMTFAYTGGAQSFTVPAGVTQITIEAWGAAGGGDCGTGMGGGPGGTVTATVAVSAGDIEYVYVGGMGQCADSTGGAGYNGGGPGGQNVTHAGGGGGGASNVQNAALGYVVVAGAGGGGGGDYGGGGAGGGTTGGSGEGGAFATGGGGGGASAGGGAGAGGDGGGNGQAGSFGQGGGGGTGGSVGGVTNGGGGGGGGYYGGGGGGGGAFSSGAGGGGGSSYAAPAATGVTMQQGTWTGSGQVVIWY